MVRILLAAVAVLVMAGRARATGGERPRTSPVLATRAPLPTSRPVPRKARAVPSIGTVPPRTTPRPIADLRTVPFAYVGNLPLFHPAVQVERVGFHQATDIHDRPLTPAAKAVAPLVMPGRGRRTSPRSAADVVVDPRAAIYAPVSGIVKRALSYHLYCKYRDSFAVISPVGHPELEVKMLHISGLRVRPGDRVVAGKTVVAMHATRFPFASEVDAFTKHHWPHVHIEVTQLAVPNAKPQVGKGLAFGCA